MSRTHDITVIGLISAMFLTNLILIGLVASYAYRVNNNEHRYQLLKEDYTRMIQQVEQSRDIRMGRIQEQIQGIQFTMDRRFGLLEDRDFLAKHKKAPE